MADQCAWMAKVDRLLAAKRQLVPLLRYSFAAFDTAGFSYNETTSILHQKITAISNHHHNDIKIASLTSKQR
jgi:hypothetical protein